MSRHFQFSLRALLVVVLIISVVLGLKTATKRRQVAAITKLRERGATITVEPGAASSAAFASKIRDALGMKSQGVKVDLFEKSLTDGGPIATRTITDDDATLIGDIHDATEVWLSSDHITAESLRVLAALPRLQRLYIGTTNIADDEIGALRNCESLTELRLYLSSVGKAGIATVMELPQLVRLDLYPVVATKESILQLGKLDRLQEIVLHVDGPTGKLDAALKRMLPTCVVVVQATGLYMMEIKD